MASPMWSGEGPAGRQSGFTLLGLLFLVALLGVGLAALGQVWETANRREKEAELLFIGDEYRRALESYYLATPGQEKHFPKTLRELLADPRFPNTVRHLRRLYRDPMTQSTDWGLVKQGEEITGLHSLSGDAPFKVDGFRKPYDAFKGAASYRNWVFAAARPGAAEASQGTAQTSKTGKPLPSGKP